MGVPEASGDDAMSTESVDLGRSSPSLDPAAFLTEVPEDLREDVAARFTAVYDELRRRAHRTLATLPPGQTIAPTELVHEAYLRLSRDTSNKDWLSDQHFVAAAALAMRHVAIDRIRRRLSARRGGGQRPLDVNEHLDAAVTPDEQLQLMVDGALDELARKHPRCAQLIQLRFFLGLTDVESARVLRVTDRTLRRDWLLAKAWLSRALSADPASVRLLGR